MPAVKRLLLTACVLISALASSAPAAARTVTLPPNSAILEYTEPFPSGGGDIPAGGIPTAPSAPLPAVVARALRGPGLARHELAHFVGVTAPRSARSHRHRASLPSPADVGGGSILRSLVRSALGGGGGMGLALPLILLVAALAAAGVLARRYWWS
jgi:hypothetical protein